MGVPGAASQWQATWQQEAAPVQAEVEAVAITALWARCWAGCRALRAWCSRPVTSATCAIMMGVGSRWVPGLHLAGVPVHPLVDWRRRLWNRCTSNYKCNWRENGKIPLAGQCEQAERRHRQQNCIESSDVGWLLRRCLKLVTCPPRLAAGQKAREAASSETTCCRGNKTYSWTRAGFC